MRTPFAAVLFCLLASAALAQIKLPGPPAAAPGSAAPTDALPPVPTGPDYETLLRSIIQPALAGATSFKAVSDTSTVYVAEFSDPALPRLIANLSEETSVLKHEDAAGYYEKGFGTCQPRTELYRGTVRGVDSAGFKVLCKSSGGSDTALFLITRHDARRTHVIGLATSAGNAEGLRTRGDFVLRDLVIAP